jgi:hypothetical protein
VIEESKSSLLLLILCRQLLSWKDIAGKMVLKLRSHFLWKKVEFTVQDICMQYISALTIYACIALSDMIAYSIYL